jgi:hypothetical protein
MVHRSFNLEMFQISMMSPEFRFELSVQQYYLKFEFEIWKNGTFHLVDERKAHNFQFTWSVCKSHCCSLSPERTCSLSFSTHNFFCLFTYSCYHPKWYWYQSIMIRSKFGSLFMWRSREGTFQFRAHEIGSERGWWELPRSRRGC